MRKRIAVFVTLLMIVTLFIDIFNYSEVGIGTKTADASIENFNPKSIDQSIWNQRWDNGGSKRIPYTTGNNFAYDIYQDLHGRSGGKIENRNFGNGVEPYFTFEGWSAIVGHRHHTTTNQKTHILAVNVETREEKMYNTYQRPGDATKDIEFNKRYSTPNTVWNECPSTARNVDPSDCSMKYPGVGFKAFIPINELFPEGVEDGQEWRLYIVKKVGDRVVYDELRIPMRMNDMTHGEGKVSFSSGVDANRLTMVANQVLRYPRKGTTVPHGTYFTKENVYNMVDSNQTGTAVWYGVRSPHDGNATRWNSSVYWEFGGDIATLRYTKGDKYCPDGTIVKEGEKCPVVMTINHRDVDTGKQLLQETFKVKEGEKYSYTSKPEGHFKGDEGEEYAPYPPNQVESGVAGESNQSFTFYYKLSEDPLLPGKYPGTEEGSTGGQISWRLYKPDKEDISQIKAENHQVVTRQHYAVKNHTIKNTTTGASFKEVTNGPHTVTGIDANAEKGGKIKYEFEYVYTNYYKYVGEVRVPDWGRQETFYASNELDVDHVRGEEFDLGVNGDKLEFTIGRSKDVVTNEEHHQQEAFTLPVGGRDRGFKTQVAMPIMESPYRYVNDFKEDFHHIQKKGHYYAYEVDKNIQDKYTNDTDKDYQPYAIPVMIDEENVQKTGRDWIIPVISKDDFYTTKGTGFIFSVPHKTSIEEAESVVKNEYKDFTGANFRDKILEVNDRQKSMYYMPIDGNGEMKEKTDYVHPLEIGKMGFNDVTIKYDTRFYFEHYLIGNIFDDTWVVEQNDPIIITEDYPHSVDITNNDGVDIKNIDRTDYIHGFRSTDGIDFYDRLRDILNLTGF